MVNVAKLTFHDIIYSIKRGQNPLFFILIFNYYLSYLIIEVYFFFAYPTLILLLNKPIPYKSRIFTYTNLNVLK